MNEKEVSRFFSDRFNCNGRVHVGIKPGEFFPLSQAQFRSNPICLATNVGLEPALEMENGTRQEPIERNNNL